LHKFHGWSVRRKKQNNIIRFFVYYKNTVSNPYNSLDPNITAPIIFEVNTSTMKYPSNDQRVMSRGYMIVVTLGLAGDE
jgi:hypothetical protein